MKIDSHTVEEIASSIRFVDYAIGIFAELPTKNAVKKAIKRERLWINGKLAQTGNWVKVNDQIELHEGIRRKPQPYWLKIEIVHEDDHLVVVHKPAGLPVNGNRFKTLENCLVDQTQPSTKPDALEWALPVHRLDSPTSGLVIFAKTQAARRAFDEMLQRRQITKTYHAVVQGKPNSQEIQLDIEKKKAHSSLEVIKSVPSLQNEWISLVKLEPKTGRTHQLRFHCASIGHPIVGDKTYGLEGNILKHKGLFLCATGLSFIHPISNQQLNLKLDIPEKFNSYLNREEKRWNKFRNAN